MITTQQKNPGPCRRRVSSEETTDGRSASGGARSRSVLLGQLGPNQVPVVGAKVAARYGAFGGLLNGNAALDRYLSNVVSPLTDEDRRHTNNSRKFGCRLIGEVFVQVHEVKISTELINMQQHFAYRVNVSELLSCQTMNRAELMAKTRRENFAKLKARYKTNAALADKLGDGFSPSYVSQLLSGHRSIGDEVAEKIETRLGCGVGYLDQADAPAQPSPQVSMRKVWVIGRGTGGMPDRIWTDGDFPVGASNEYAEERTDDDHAFIVRVNGDSMSPRYMPGEYVLVEPSVAPELEDDVLVRLANGKTLIKRLLSRRGGIRLGSYSTPDAMTFAEHEITWMYYVSNRVPSHKIKHWIEAPA